MRRILVAVGLVVLLVAGQSYAAGGGGAGGGMGGSSGGMGDGSGGMGGSSGSAGGMGGTGGMGGSGTGIAAMINGTVDIANASREMKAEEKTAARANGIDPVEFTVARDAIAVVVNPRNPVAHLTLQHISDIYTGKITNWKKVGGEDRPIVLLSRESNSGTYVYFLEHVLRMNQKKSDLLFSPETLLMPSSEGISSEVRQNPNAIGYDGLGYVTADMKTVAVGKGADGPFVLPAIATVNDGTYPISRSLYMYTAGQPAGKTAEWMNWIHSDGQALVAKLGFVPIIK